jgi:16S rRNA C1402 N4-methylase RsmH
VGHVGIYWAAVSRAQEGVFFKVELHSFRASVRMEAESFNAEGSLVILHFSSLTDMITKHATQDLLQ